MLEFKEGDFFDYEADIRINTVNCVGIMGAGVALMFKNKFPAMFKEYCKACKDDKVKPGIPHVWEEINLFSSLTIINFPTKVHWRNPSEYEYIEEGLIWLRRYLQDKENSTVTLPALGCGHGGLEWDKVKEMIMKYLGNINTRILVFEPSSSTQNNISSIERENLKDKDIYRVLPTDKLYPSKLRGISALELYCKGNIELLNKKNISIIVDSKPQEREKNALIRFLDELPRDKFVFLLGLSNSYEIDLVKEMLSRGFKIIITIPYGILNLKVRKDLEEVWNYKNILIISAVSPNQTWKNYESLNCFKFRLSISDIILINSMNLNYINKYKNYIKKANSKVFYINYWINDVDILYYLEAQKIGVSPKTGKPNVLSIIEAI